LAARRRSCLGPPGPFRPASCLPLK
jgi:hypothetical protein